MTTAARCRCRIKSSQQRTSQEKHGRISAPLLRPIRQRLSRRADAQSDRRRLGADLRRLLRQRRAALAGVARRRQRDGRSAGARSRRQEADAVRRDPDLSRRALRKIPAARRGRAARSAALDHFRQSEGQRLSRAVSLPAQFCQTRRPSGGDGISQGPHRQRARHRRQAARRPPVHSRIASRPSPTCRWSPTSTIRPRNSASTSRRHTRTSPPGSTASRRCRAGSIPTT